MKDTTLVFVVRIEAKSCQRKLEMLGKNGLMAVWRQRRVLANQAKAERSRRQPTCICQMLRSVNKEMIKKKQNNRFRLWWRCWRIETRPVFRVNAFPNSCHLNTSIRHSITLSFTWRCISGSLVNWSERVTFLRSLCQLKSSNQSQLNSLNLQMTYAVSQPLLNLFRRFKDKKHKTKQKGRDCHK